MGCGTSFVKYILFFFNLIFALCGLLILGSGVMLKLNITEFDDLLDTNMNLMPIWCIIIGSIIFVIAFFGCCGAVRESHCMVVTYAVIMLIIIILQVVIGILIFVYIGNVDAVLRELMERTFKDSSNGNAAAKEAFDSLQTHFQCCGINSAADYNFVVPVSCCANPSGVVESTLSTCLPTQAYSQGCAYVLTNFLKTAGKTVGGVAIGIAAVEVVGAIFALCLANSIKNAERRYR
ncbi:tetraspanin 42Ed isoform X2 [Arctopsyche grandis]|uniref:tetraspanin 42Ed isoform X2 n=1 Tax=Arctopsyche grandis TaxID=121162 RepID=UPI00406D7795